MLKTIISTMLIVAIYSTIIGKDTLSEERTFP